MPNVNYRGKPSQDPNAPPESGVTSIPLGAPWPPLSREQVVKLHEALVEFGAALDLRRGSWMDARVAWRLREVIRSLGIGSPPPQRTWTHEEVANVAEEVQRESPVTFEEATRSATAHAIYARQERVDEAPKRNCWTCRLGSEQFCPLTQGANVGTAKREDVVNWRLSHLQVTQQTDGCPGWERKP